MGQSCTIAGRHIWDGGSVTYCTCGHAWYGDHREQADARWLAHQAQQERPAAEHSP